MLSIQTSEALETHRPPLGRQALIVGIVSMVCVLWIEAVDRIDGPLLTSGYFPVTTAGDVDVPGYYFPLEADTTETYIAAKQTDCGRTSSTPPHDYPIGWLKP